MAGTSNSIITHNVLKGTLNSDNAISGLVNTAFNPAYALVNEAGAQIVLFLNNNDYKMYAQLKDKNGNLIYTSNIIDLPIESMVVNGRYDENTKKLVLVLDNGNEIEVPLGALISGLVNEDDLEANYYDNNEINTILEGYWTKVELTQEDIDNWNAKQEYLNQGDGIEISAETTLKGNTSQESTTGKNLLNIFNFEMGSMSNGYIISSPYRINNVNNPIEVKPNTTYCVSSILSTQVKGMRCGVHECDENMTFKKDSGWQQLATNPYVFTTENDTKYVKIVFTLSKTSTNVQTETNEDITSYNNAVDWTRGCLFQLEEGNTATSWEPYTNGPAPNPDYPYPVNVVTGDNEVKVEGKNLLPPTNRTTAVNGVTTAVNSDGSVTISGTPSSNWFLIGADTNSVSIPAGTYTFSIQDTLPGSIRLDLTYSDSTTENIFTITSGNKSRTVTTSKTITNIRVEVTNNASSFTFPTTIKMMLESGSTASSYEPYQSQTYPINLGSMELCKIGDYQDVIKRSSGKNIINSLEYHRSCNSSTGVVSTPSSSTNSYLSIEDYVNVKPNTTYTVSFQHDDLTGNLFIGTKDINGNFIERLGLGTVRTFTTGSNVHQIFIFIYKSGENYTIDGWTQLNEGNQDLPYEPYGKVWYKYGAIGKVVLDGSETGWGDRPNYTDADRFVKDSVFPTNNRNMYCNYFRVNQITDNTYPYLTNNGTQCIINFSAKGTTTLEQFKTWLSTHNTTVYYVLATPTITEITDTTLISQLNALTTGFSNNWVENISQTNADLPFEIEYDNTNLTISANLTDYYTKTETNTLLNEKVGFTDYGTTNTGGVIRDGTTSLGYEIAQTGANVGKLGARILSYTQYQNNLYTNGFIGKGTLENVLNERIGDIQTLLDNLNTGSGV